MGKYIRLITFLGKAKKETAVKTTISLAVVALSFTQAFFLAQGVSAVFAQEELQTVFTWFLLCLAALLARAWILRFQEGIYQEDGSKSQKRYSGCHVGKVDGIRSVLPQ